MPDTSWTRERFAAEQSELVLEIMAMLIRHERKINIANIKAWVACDECGIPWPDIIRLFCDCGKPHTPQQISQCQVRVAANVRHLRALLTELVEKDEAHKPKS